jgi:hypothetical protein
MNWSEQNFTGFGQLLIVRTVESDIKHHNPSAIFQLYHGENKLIFNEMMMSSVFSSLCHHLASFVCCPLTFYILIFSSETPRPNELKLGGEDFFLNRPIRNKNSLWWPCLLMDREKMCNL